MLARRHGVGDPVISKIATFTQNPRRGERKGGELNFFCVARQPGQRSTTLRPTQRPRRTSGSRCVDVNALNNLCFYSSFCHATGYYLDAIEHEEGHIPGLLRQQSHSVKPPPLFSGSTRSILTRGTLIATAFTLRSLCCP